MLEARQKTHFFRMVGGVVQSIRLGELLVASRLITQEELNKALVLQKLSHEPLGKILVREGLVSAAQIYRKLAAQWCLKMSAAGLTILMHVFSPVSVSADDTNAQPGLRLAAIFSADSTAATKHLLHPALFNTSEVVSNNISMFTKWTSVMAHFRNELKTQKDNPVLIQWEQRLQSLRGKSAEEQLAGINDYANAIKYVEDIDNYHVADYWATPVEFFSRGGDCEDYAIAKYASLRALGFSADQLRIAIVQDQVKNVPHAILIVYTEQGAFVLDNQDRQVRPAADISRYKPLFSINGAHWWLHNA